jgi:hypothetical protein
MTDALPPPRYTIWQSLAVAVGLGTRALEEIRALKAAPPPIARFPAARSWTDEVHYAGAVVVHGGATWQAIRDTGKPPPADDWLCLSVPGLAGANGRSLTMRGTYDPAASYAALDVVTLEGSSFAARSDKPGNCPGEGWQLLGRQGSRGKPGERGAPGPGLRLASFTVSDDGLLTLAASDGSTVTCDLYPLLARLRS